MVVIHMHSVLFVILYRNVMNGGHDRLWHFQDFSVFLHSFEIKCIEGCWSCCTLTCVKNKR
jgi:hypothetical protein